MKIKILHIALYFVFITGTGFIINSCKPKKQEIPPFVNVTLEVKDEQQQTIDSAEAYLYSSQETYDAAYQNTLKGIYNTVGSFVTGTVVNGQLVFPQIPSNQEYWILIHDNSQKFLGTTIPIHRDNTGANFYIDKYQNGTEVFADIKLEPVNALIKIVSASGVAKFDTMDIGNKYNRIPISNLGGYIEVRKGDVPYMVRDKICIWTGAINAVGGVITTENLDKCSQAGIKFIYEGTFTSDSIMIYLGQNKIPKPVAVLKSSKQSEIVYLGTGTDYTYFAEMANGKKCVWESDSILSPNGGKILTVSLKPCY